MATPTTLPATFVAGDVLTAAQQNALRGAFRVLQVVQGTTTTLASTTGGTYLDTNLTATITPSSTSSLVLVYVSQRTYSSAANAGVKLRLMRGATGIVETLDVNLNAGGASTSLFNPIYLDNPATTSATTYKTQYAIGSGAGTAIVQPSNNLASIILMEISA
jgi:hypothetical protein